MFVVYVSKICDEVLNELHAVIALQISCDRLSVFESTLNIFSIV